MPYTTTLQPESTDSTQLSLHKIAQIMFANAGTARPTLSFHPTTAPTSGDSEELLCQKLVKLFGG